jgi:hypothetical protein
MGLFNFWKSKTKQAVIEGALEGVEALENIDASAAEAAAQNALASLSEKVKVVGGQPVVQVNIVNVGGTVALPGSTVEAPALPAPKVTVVEATEPAPADKPAGKKAAKK